MERITSVDEVPDQGSFLFTVRDDGEKAEVILVRFGDGDDIAAWKNFCQHEIDQPLDRGFGAGAAVRDGGIVCPKHGSIFDAKTGYCDNGRAAGSTLVEVDIAVNRGDVFLVDDCEFVHVGGIGDDSPGSTSHLSF